MRSAIVAAAFAAGAIAVPLMVVVAWCLMWVVDYIANRGKRMISQQRSHSTKVDHHG